MPRDEGTKICQNFSEIDCQIRAYWSWLSEEDPEARSINNCECLLSCNFVKYSTDFYKSAPLEELVTDLPVKYPEK